MPTLLADRASAMQLRFKAELAKAVPARSATAGGPKIQLKWSASYTEGPLKRSLRKLAGT